MVKGSLNGYGRLVQYVFFTNIVVYIYFNDFVPIFVSLLFQCNKRQNTSY